MEPESGHIIGPERLEEEEVIPDGGDYVHLQNKEPTEKRGMGRGQRGPKAQGGVLQESLRRRPGTGT